MESIKHGGIDQSILTELVTQRMEQLLGETASRILFDYLKRDHHLLTGDICERSEVFFAGLEEVVGVGAKMLERLVLKDLYSNFLEYEEKEGYKFSDYLKELVKLS
jgi:hypothetical protein